MASTELGATLAALWRRYAALLELDKVPSVTLVRSSPHACRPPELLAMSFREFLNMILFLQYRSLSSRKVSPSGCVGVEHRLQKAGINPTWHQARSRGLAIEEVT
jgi:hypothetical protein